MAKKSKVRTAPIKNVTAWRPKTLMKNTKGKK